MVRTLLVNLCRLVLATVFILSGLVKIIDPRGFSYKIDEYAGAAGITDFHLAHASLFIAGALAMLEFSVGIYLFFGIRRRLTSLVTLLMMTVFTAFTFWSWRWHAE
jgi:triosephosphate isomerase